MENGQQSHAQTMQLPAMQRTCLESRQGREQWGVIQTGRCSLFVFLVSVFTVFFSLATLPLWMQGRGPHEHRIWSCVWKIRQRAGSQVWKLPWGVKSSTHAYILKSPRQTSFHGTKRQWMVHPLAVVTTIHLPKQCSQASVSQEYNGPVSTHTSLQ